MKRSWSRSFSKVFTLLFALTLIFNLAVGQAFAGSNIEDITLDSGTMFSVGLGVGEEFSYLAKGLVKDASGKYQKVDIPDPQNITWEIADPAVLEFVGGFTGEAVTVKAKAEGESWVVANYSGMSVHSSVFVETDSSNATIQNVKVAVKGIEVVVDEENYPSINNFSLKTIYGSNYNDSGVKKNKVTALHALLWALEDEFGSIGDWDWVRDNVVVGYNGSFVSKIGSDVNHGMTGWMYKVKKAGSSDWQMPPIAASQCVLGDGDQVKWGFAAWGEEW